MKKNEFMAQLKHYFRNSEPADLQGIIEDCEEQFRLGTKKTETGRICLLSTGTSA